MELFDTQDRRLYLSCAERAAFLAVTANASRKVRTFCLVLYYTGCWISEALTLTPQRSDFSARRMFEIRVTLPGRQD